MSEKLERECEVTGRRFVISAEEAEAYCHFELPLPSLCPQERLRRQLSFRNDEQFFWRTCSLSGGKIFSVYPQNSVFPVIGQELWQGTDWDALKYGFEYEPQRLFVDQLLDLWTKVPRPAYLLRDSEASPACNGSSGLSRCFLVFSGRRASDCCYCSAICDCNCCVDCYQVFSSDDCYECVHCYECRLLRWSECCVSCEDSWFLSHCSNCKNCLFCCNLDGKQFCIFNEQLSPEEYQTAVRDWQFSARTRVEAAKEEFSAFLSDKPIPHIFSDNPRNTSGNYLMACDAAFDSFECVDCRNIVHCHGLISAEDCLDGLGFGNGLSRALQFVSVGDGAEDIVNCIECSNGVKDLSYCTYCEESQHLFACVGLRGKEYCIFNVQYSKTEYQSRKREIVEDLRERKIWGKFFPVSFSSLAYNRSSAEVFMPLSKIPAQMMGFRWDEAEDAMRPSQLLGGDAAPDERFLEVPDRLEEATAEDLRQLVFLCELSGKPFRIRAEDLALHQRLGVSLPARCYAQRHPERIRRLAPRVVIERPSNGRQELLQTAYPANWRQPVVSHSEWDEEVLSL